MKYLGIYEKETYVEKHLTIIEVVTNKNDWR